MSGNIHEPGIVGLNLKLHAEEVKNLIEFAHENRAFLDAIARGESEDGLGFEDGSIEEAERNSEVATQRYHAMRDDSAVTPSALEAARVSMENWRNYSEFSKENSELIATVWDRDDNDDDHRDHEICMIDCAIADLKAYHAWVSDLAAEIAAEAPSPYLTDEGNSLDNVSSSDIFSNSEIGVLAAGVSADFGSFL